MRFRKQVHNIHTMASLVPAIQSLRVCAAKDSLFADWMDGLGPSMVCKV